MITLPLRRLLCEYESWNRRAKGSNSAMDRLRARPPLAGSYRYRRTAAGIAACCARLPECKDAFHETARPLAIRRFAAAVTRAIGPRAEDRRCRRRRHIRCGRTYQFGL